LAVGSNQAKAQHLAKAAHAKHSPTFVIERGRYWQVVRIEFDGASDAGKSAAHNPEA